MINLSVFYSIFLIFKSVCADRDLTLVFASKEDGQYDASCIIGENSLNTTTFWSKNNGQQPIASRSSSRYIPSYFQINFSENKNFDDWQVTNWNIGESTTTQFGPVMDERWEMFQTEKLTETKHLWNGTKFVSVSLSVFILNMDYRILILDKYYMDISADSCSVAHSGINVLSTLKFEDANKVWFHFAITKLKNIMKVTFFPNKKKISWSINKSETPTFIKISKGIKYSNNTKPGFYKLHKYKYLYSEKMFKNAHEIGTAIRHKGKLCIAMFGAVCDSCSVNMTLNVDGKHFDETTVINAEDDQNGHYLWKRIVIKKDIDVKDNITLFVQKINQKSEGGFWAIGNIRICQSSEMRIVSVNRKFMNNTECRSLTDTKFDVSVSEINLTDLTCQAGQLGESCNINCQSIFQNENYCGNTICISNGCSCSWGFHGKNCNIACSKSFWGENCKDKCGKCKDNEDCNRFNGTCPHGCVTPYTGVKCSGSLPVLNNKPEGKNISHTFIKVGIHKEYTGSYSPSKIQIQYRKQKEKIWTIFITVEYKNDFQMFNISNLTPATTYDIRGVLVAEEGSHDEDEDVPILTVTTTCKDITPDIIDIKPDKYFANVTFQYKDPTLCNLEMYTVNLLWPSNSRNITDSIEWTIMNLLAYNNYTIRFFNKRTNSTIEKSFQTKPIKPGKVENITWELSSEKMLLGWDAPPKSGKNISYIIIYKLIGHKACNLNITEKQPLHVEIQTEQIHLEQLIPYAYYNISIQAKNEAGSGEIFDMTTATKESDDLSKDLPTNVTVKDGEGIKIFPPSCEKVKGPLTYTINYVYNDSQSCINDTKDVSDSVDYKNETIMVNPSKDLIPYSNYLITILARRNKMTDLKYGYHIIPYKSKPSKPPKIRKSMIYSKNESHVWLRWIAPCPTNGQLEKYVINVTHNTGEKLYFTSDVIKIPCLWRNEVCVVIKNLTPNQNYKFAVHAKNQDVADYGEPVYLEQVTREEESDPPKNLTHKFEAEEFSLSWVHPDVTNGPLRQFKINVYVVDSMFQDPAHNISEEYLVVMDQLYYNKKLNVTPASVLHISVAAINSRKGKPASIEVTVPPPKPKLSSSPFIRSCSEGTCLINIPSASVCVNCTSYVIVTSKTEENTISPFLKMPFYEKIYKNKENTEILQYQHWIAEKNSFEHQSVQNISIVKAVGERVVYYNNNYVIHIMLVSSYKGEYNTKTYRLDYGIEESRINGLYYLFLLLVIPLAVLSFFTYRFWIKNKDGNEEYRSTNADSPLKKNAEHFPEDTSPLMKLPPIVPKSKVVKEAKPKDSKVIELSNLKSNSQLDKQHEENTYPLRKSPPIAPKPSKETKHKYTKVIQLHNFKSYLKETAEGDTNHSLLNQQHEMCKRGYNKPVEIGSKDINKKKNRYKDLIAYDHTRVKLKYADENGSDYINANYIDGYNTKRTYIATQGPKSNTVNDFWQMIWEQNVDNIVMLANVIENGKKKCEEYWPPLNQSVTFQDISIQNIDTNVFSSYIYRELQVTCKGHKRIINHLHFTLWPDHGVPLYPQNLVPFMRQILKLPQGKHPIVVHCSAGIGRTGTILLCDIVLRMAALEQKLDFLKIYHQLREQRPAMVDNAVQYILAHLVVYECLFGKDFSIPLDNNFKQRIQNLMTEDSIKSMMDYLEEVSWQIKIMQECFHNELLDVNKGKNRFQTIIPGWSQLYLERYPEDDESSDYINAVGMDCFQNQDRFIVTQQPLPNTVGDFWRLILQYNVNTIVSLNEIQQEDHTSCIFWPNINESFYPVDYIKVACQDEEDRGDYNLITIVITDKNENEKRYITIICLNGWMPGKAIPADPASLLAIREHMFNTTFRQENPIVITCYDGAKASGLFVALSFLIEKIKLEHSCDVVLAASTARQRRMQCVRDKEQFKFLLKAALLYFESFETYSNFDNL